MTDTIFIKLPKWVDRLALRGEVFSHDIQKIRLSIKLANENRKLGKGRPFGAAVFERESGRLISVGLNLVSVYNNPFLHAELVALLEAQQSLRGCTNPDEILKNCELAASSEPCAMCLGAAWYTGIRRVVFGSLAADAIKFGFGGGPAVDKSFNKMEIVPGVCADEALAVLEKFRNAAFL